MIDILGDRPINEYASSEAGKLRDVLLKKGLAYFYQENVWLYQSHY